MNYFPKAFTLYLYAALILWVACYSANDKKEKEGEFANTAESFDSFFTRFKQDSGFQRTHIEFPLVNKTDIWNDMKMQTMETMEWVEASNWTFHNFEEESDGAIEWALSKHVVGDTARVALRSMQDRLGVDLTFVYADNTWMLNNLHNRTTITQYQGLYAIGVSDEFKLFFEEFRSSREFQLQHTKFDLVMQYPAEEGEGMQTKYITRQDFAMLNITNSGPKEGENVEYIVRQEGDKAIVWMRCLDCGISMEYFFEPNGSSWRLERVEDHSM